jgi:tryptophan synthase alpha chain
VSNRIDQRFSALRADGKTALIPFLTAGYPDPEWTVPILRALVQAGADVLELGVPFSDPSADGPVIQAASEQAMRASACGGCWNWCGASARRTAPPRWC